MLKKSTSGFFPGNARFYSVIMAQPRNTVFKLRDVGNFENNTMAKTRHTSQFGSRRGCAGPFGLG